MVKIASIRICLLEECERISNRALEREILNALSEMPIKIPWMKKIYDVKVTEEQ